MALRWIMLVLISLIKYSKTNDLESSEETELKELPLTKSLGFAIRNNFGKNLDDARLNQEYLYRYREMMKASQESFESLEGRVQRKLRKADEGGLPDRRHDSARPQSAVGVRRARSQELRRRKLNSQGLRSHQKHSKKSSAEFDLD